MPGDALDDIDVSHIKDPDLKLVAALMKSELRAQRVVLQSIHRDFSICRTEDHQAHADLQARLSAVKEEVGKHGLIFGALGAVGIAALGYFFDLLRGGR